MLTALVAALAIGVVSDGLPRKMPNDVGMSAERLEAIDRVVARGISAGGYPGAAVVVGRRGAAVYQKGFGTLGWTSGSPRVVSDRTIYDLASLTKVVGTTTAVMVLYDQGQLGLDDPISKYIPEFTGGGKELVTVRHLLTHRSGLPAGRDLWRVATNPATAREAVINTPIYCRPGQCYEYSDLGADMLGFLVEEISGQRLDKFLAEHVFQPLGMSDTYFQPGDSLLERVAPTEVTPPRGYPLRGEVHDENAYALGGIAGHAGLFSTAADLSIFAQMMLNGGVYNGVRVVSDSTVALFTHRAAGTRGLGWDTCDGQGGCGEHMSERAYGHTGYTGTSIWIDPDREMFVVLLTNRVHAARAKRPAKVISDVRADLADAAAVAVTDDPDNVLAMPVAFRADRAIGWNTTERPRRSRASRRTPSARSRAAAAARRSTARKSSSKKSSAKKASASRSTAKVASGHNARRGKATAAKSQVKSKPAAKSKAKAAVAKKSARSSKRR